MGLVAFIAFGSSQFTRVRFMALGALRDLTVNAVTGGTVKCGMLAFVVPQLSNLLRMAVLAGLCACKRNCNTC